MDFEAQKSVYNVMIANTTLTNLVTGIYDEPPTNLNYPYVVIGGGGNTPFLKHEYDGINNNFLITIFTDPGSLGFYSAECIASEIKSVLHLKKLSVSDTNLKNVITILENQDRERDGGYRNIDMRFKIILEKTTKEV